jgi:phospholipase/carboxylesterase
MRDTLSYVHRFIPGPASAAPLLLLHGTGGNETDLIPLGETVAPGRSLLSPRGRVLEHGMPRFFRRIAEGVLDEDDIRLKAGELAAFIGEARAAYGLGAPVALGFSNGANIAAALLLLHPAALAGAVLVRAMAPLKSPPPTALPGTPVLIISGRHDPMMAVSLATKLAGELRDGGAEVQHDIIEAGHGLTQHDLKLATRWLATKG